jgi:lysophospholipase L1-like esterase
VLGDSFVDGSDVGDEETFTWHLQQRLENVEVINLGVYGYSTAQELITLEKVGLRYHPDLVILMTMTNDYSDNLFNFSFHGPAPRFVLRNHSIELETTDHPDALRKFHATNLPLPAMRSLHKRSMVYYVLNHYIYQRLLSKRIEALIVEQNESLSLQEKHELYLEIVSRMKALCDRSGIALKVVFVYPKKQVMDGPNSPSAEIVAGLAARGIDVVDLYPVLKDEETGSGRSLYYEQDFHWNPRGHEFVASILLDQVQSWINDLDSDHKP